MLAVPVLPGRELELPQAVPPPPPGAGRRRLLLAAGALAAAGAVAAATVLLARGPGARRPAPAAVPPPAPRVATHPRPAPPPPRPTPAERARAAAERLAAGLPVRLETAALLRRGGSVYVVGGSVDGVPTDAVWRIDLARKRVVREGTFLEPLADAAAARRGGALYLAGGWTGEKLATAVLRWTPDGGAALVARLPAAVRGAHAAFAGAQLYVVGGSPRSLYAVDVGAGTVRTPAAAPAAARAAGSNLDYLTRALLASG